MQKSINFLVQRLTKSLAPRIYLFLNEILTEWKNSAVRKNCLIVRQRKVCLKNVQRKCFCHCLTATSKLIKLRKPAPFPGFSITFQFSEMFVFFEDFRFLQYIWANFVYIPWKWPYRTVEYIYSWVATLTISHIGVKLYITTMEKRNWNQKEIYGHSEKWLEVFSASKAINYFYFDERRCLEMFVFSHSGHLKIHLLLFLWERKSSSYYGNNR